MVERKHKSYSRSLGERARCRYEITRTWLVVEEFAAQLEYDTTGDNGWVPVYRCDTAHGEVHVHVFGPGEERRVSMSSTFSAETGYSDALSTAQQEIGQRWECHIERFADEDERDQQES